MRDARAAWLSCAFMCAGAAFAPAGSAQEWKPSRNIEFIVNSGAGGAGDRAARVPQRLLQGLPGMPSISVVNKPGGGGNLAYTYLAQHEKDAHYLCTLSTGLLTNEIVGVSKLSYRDLTPLNILMREQGIDAEYYAWRGFVAPRGLTPAQIAFWDQAFARITRSDEWRKELADNGWADGFTHAAETRRRLDAEFGLLTTMLGELGLVARGTK